MYNWVITLFSMFVQSEDTIFFSVARLVWGVIQASKLMTRAGQRAVSVPLGTHSIKWNCVQLGVVCLYLCRVGCGTRKSNACLYIYIFIREKNKRQRDGERVGVGEKRLISIPPVYFVDVKRWGLEKTSKPPRTIFFLLRNQVWFRVIWNIVHHNIYKFGYPSRRNVKNKKNQILMHDLLLNTISSCRSPIRETFLVLRHKWHHARWQFLNRSLTSFTSTVVQLVDRW